MSLLEKQLFVKKSTLTGAGKGLFTRKFIPKGTRIVEYKGKTRTWKEVQAEEDENPYIYYVKRSHVIDALNDKKALARYANDATGLNREQHIKNNAEYVEEGVRVFIEASRDIPANSEIFVSYGKEYWQVIRYNIRLDEKAKKQQLNGKASKSQLNGKATKVNGKTTKVNGKAAKVNGKAVKVNGKVAKTKVNGNAIKEKVNGKKVNGVVKKDTGAYMQ